MQQRTTRVMQVEFFYGLQCSLRPSMNLNEMNWSQFTIWFFCDYFGGRGKANTVYFRGGVRNQCSFQQTIIPYEKKKRCAHQKFFHRDTLSRSLKPFLVRLFVFLKKKSFIHNLIRVHCLTKSRLKRTSLPTQSYTRTMPTRHLFRTLSNGCFITQQHIYKAKFKKGLTFGRVTLNRLDFSSDMEKAGRNQLMW